MSSSTKLFLVNYQPGEGGDCALSYGEECAVVRASNPIEAIAMWKQSIKTGEWPEPYIPDNVPVLELSPEGEPQIIAKIFGFD